MASSKPDPENTEDLKDKTQSVEDPEQKLSDGVDENADLTDKTNVSTETPVDTEDPQMVWMRRYFAKSLGILFEDPPECLLDEVSFEGIARYIASDKCNKIVVMTGAGISTSAGIPDFRSPNTGCYEQLKKEYNIENPQKLFEYSYFKGNPEPYYKYRKDIWKGTYKPTPCHYFIRMLENKNKLLRHFTQNIDGLEMLAGISEDKLIQAHGTINHSYCMDCGQTYTQKWVRDKIYGPEGPVPRCANESCRGIVRPKIVMFGENLPERFAEHLSDIDDCDMLLIMGTSLAVRPFSNLPIRTKDNVPRLFINLESIRVAKHPISALFFGGGFDFENEDNIRDVFWKGKCDEGCFALADIMGWGDELRKLVKEEHAVINKELGITDETGVIDKTTENTGSTSTKKPARLGSNTQDVKRVQTPQRQSVHNRASKISQGPSDQAMKPVTKDKRGVPSGTTQRKTSTTPALNLNKSVCNTGNSKK
ncbi:NAD-dependent protein deacetylase sirtuin-2-like [Ruditapes philippinarum]|uniref:NAD-dependent protein deacetylase sirtuin-2-like n=1 Tax=Ruditapes philippinarum TaxID=129788 RepID=UPI00295B344A|nr:NAD-dependent protein deacetylase sirtuin-2-like [Ruditapes philippinarum]